MASKWRFYCFRIFFIEKTIFTRRNEVVAKVIFLHLSVILFTGGVASVHAGMPTPTPRSRLRHTVYERPVRILLECILVLKYDHVMLAAKRVVKYGCNGVFTLAKTETMELGSIIITKVGACMARGHA